MVKRIGRDIPVERPELETSPLAADGIESSNFIDMIEGGSDALQNEQHNNDNKRGVENYNSTEHQVNNETSNHEIDEEMNVNDEIENDTQVLDTSHPRSIPAYSRISSLFKKRDLQELASQISAIDSQLPHEFIKYRDAVERKERLGDDLISQVLHQNEKLKSRIIQLKTKIGEMKVENHKADNGEENLKHNDSNNDGIYEDKLKLNFLELLTGIKCDDFTEINEVFTFKIIQEGSKGLKHTYSLIIDKSDSENVTYYPIFTEESESIKELLPKYLHNNITFPVATIRLFYQKVAQSLL